MVYQATDIPDGEIVEALKSKILSFDNTCWSRKGGTRKEGEQESRVLELHIAQLWNNDCSTEDVE